MTSGWQRRSGLVTSPDGRADRARGFLDGALVLALLETEPEEPDAVALTVATDAEDRVAVLDDDRTTIVPGPPLSELALALVEVCGGQVSFDELVVGEVTEQHDDHSDPFDSEIGVDTAFVPDRSVVYTRAQASDLTALATAIDLPILTAPHRDGQLALITDGPALSAVEWPDALKPALVLEQGAAYPAVAVVDGDDAHLHTWDTDVVVVPSDPALVDLVCGFADEVLGAGALVTAIGRVLPDADRDAVRAAIDGDGAGPDRLVAALGLPGELAGFLDRTSELPNLEGAKILQPDGFGQAIARAVTDASTQMSESMREHTEHVRERAEHRAELMRERAEHRAELMRERAEQARVRAESAFDAAETFTEEVVVPIRQSWWTPAVAAVEATAGALALHRAGKGARVGTGTTAGERVLAVGGVLLLVDAVVNTVVFLAPRVKKDL